MHRTGVVSQRLVLQVVHMEQLVAETCRLVCPGLYGSKYARLSLKDLLLLAACIDDAKLEANIEKVHLLNKETIILSDINIEFHRKRNYDKHRLVKGLRSMNFKQLTTEVTRQWDLSRYLPRSLPLKLATLDYQTTCLSFVFVNTVMKCSTPTVTKISK